MKKVVVIAWLFVFVVGALFARGSAEASQSKAAPQLTIQLMSDAPPDNDMVTAAINKILLPKLNVTVKFQHLTWTDWQQNYRLLLASRAPMDILYAANWDSYASYARNGAYLQLDSVVPKVVPDLYKAIPKTSWDGVKVDGKIYAVPALRYAFSGSFHMIYREDLAKKYGVAPVTDIPSMEKYFDAIAKNDPSMYPVEERGDGWMLTLFTYLVAKGHPSDAWSAGVLPQSELLYLDYRHPHSAMKAPWEFPEYMPFLQQMHEYAQKGYWSRKIGRGNWGRRERRQGSRADSAGRDA